MNDTESINNEKSTVKRNITIDLLDDYKGKRLNPIDEEIEIQTTTITTTNHNNADSASNKMMLSNDLYDENYSSQSDSDSSG